MKTIGDYMTETGRTEIELLALIEPAYMGGVADYLGRMGILYDWDGVVAALGSEEAANAVADCDGTCPGCTKKNGEGCYAIALFRLHVHDDPVDNKVQFEPRRVLIPLPRRTVIAHYDIATPWQLRAAWNDGQITEWDMCAVVLCRVDKKNVDEWLRVLPPRIREHLLDDAVARRRDPENVISIGQGAGLGEAPEALEALCEYAARPR